MTAEELALNIIHAAGGDPARAKESAAAIKAWKEHGDVQEPPKYATEIPMDDCGLHINTGRDGTWLHFTAGSGRCASINVDVMAAERGCITGNALHDWCHDRQKQAESIKADNGQFGVGA